MKKIKILVDLKPALDAYAGIPQENRLLFSILRRLDNGFDVEGMLQHGSETLVAGDPVSYSTAPPHEKVFQSSQTVISFYKNPITNRFSRLFQKIKRGVALQQLRWQSIRNRTIRMGVLEAGLFDDFVWTKLFSKTLKVKDKELVTSSRFRVIRESRGMLHLVGMAGLTRYIKPRYLRLKTDGYDFVLVQTPFPARVSSGTKLVIRYHDAIPILMPHTIDASSFHQASHFLALKDNMESGAVFVCNSEATKSDLLKIFPEAEPRATVIHNIISDGYFKSDAPRRLVQNIVNIRLNDNAHSLLSKGELLARDKDKNEDMSEYLLMVSTLEPRKNHALLIAAWERLKNLQMPDLKLVLVGGQGWDFDPIIKMMRPWMQCNELFHLTDVPIAELRVLYQHAAATICPSLSEGFDYSGIEAMRCGGLVISSDIPVHREVYGDGSAYFDPYCVEDAISVIGRVLGQDAEKEREALLQASDDIAERYTAGNILPQWREFLTTHSTTAV